MEINSNKMLRLWSDLVLASAGQGKQASRKGRGTELGSLSVRARKLLRERLPVEDQLQVCLVRRLFFKKTLEKETEAQRGKMC